jgi:hypothetical protein
LSRPEKAGVRKKGIKIFISSYNFCCSDDFLQFFDESPVLFAETVYIPVNKKISVPVLGQVGSFLSERKSGDDFF